jgi:hypothetical protein
MNFEEDWNIPTVISGRPVLFFWRFDPGLASRTQVFGLAIVEGPRGTVALYTCEDDWMPMAATRHADIEAAMRVATSRYVGADPTWEPTV